MDLNKLFAAPPPGKKPPTLLEVAAATLPMSPAPAAAPATSVSAEAAVKAKLDAAAQARRDATAAAVGAPVTPSAAPTEIESPPGLPQAYIDVNFKNQPVPEPIDLSAIEAQAAASSVLAVRRVPGGESMCNVTDIPFTPGYEPPVVTARIAQGPRVFASRAGKEQHDHAKEAAEVVREPKAPTLAHPDTSKPGRFIRGDSPPYRPGA